VRRSFLLLFAENGRRESLRNLALLSRSRGVRHFRKIATTKTAQHHTAHFDDMAPMQKKTKIERARQFLKGGGVTREDSDDELGTEDYPWIWIHDGEDEDASKIGSKKRTSVALSSGTITGARMGSFECYLGDAVLLKADGSEAWVGIINKFFEDEDTGEKMANFMWFSTPREIRNKVKKRTDALEVSLLLDVCSLRYLLFCRMNST
jgi:hypothetical protein